MAIGSSRRRRGGSWRGGRWRRRRGRRRGLIGRVRRRRRRRRGRRNIRWQHGRWQRRCRRPRPGLCPCRGESRLRLLSHEVKGGRGVPRFTRKLRVRRAEIIGLQVGGSNHHDFRRPEAERLCWRVSATRHGRRTSGCEAVQQQLFRRSRRCTDARTPAAKGILWERTSMTVADLGAHQTSACNGSRDSVFVSFESTQLNARTMRYSTYFTCSAQTSAKQWPSVDLSSSFAPARASRRATDPLAAVDWRAPPRAA